MNNFNTQVTKDHYFKQYDDLSRFASYFCQIDLVKKLKSLSLLEIGIGNKTVSNYLTESGINVDTCDFDANLHPKYVADIRNLPFVNDSYELVMACEIIEHLPWSDVDIALKELNRVSQKYVIISIPYASIFFEVVFKFSFIKKIFGKSFINFCIRIPFFPPKLKLIKEHYWEMGRKGYSSKIVKNKLGEYFNILDEIRPTFNPYHQFFVLEKIKNIKP